MTLLLIICAIGLAGGTLSGFLGIGGGIITAPLLLYVPLLFGQEPLSMHTVSGLTITQSLFQSNNLLFENITAMFKIFKHIKAGTSRSQKDNPSFSL